MLTIVTVLFKPKEVMKTAANTAVYSPEWANKLYRGFARNMTKPFRFVCLSDHDKSEGFIDEIEVIPFIHSDHVGTWMCINEIFRPDLKIEHGLFVGLDTVICRNVDFLHSYKGRFCMVRHPRHPNRAMNAITLFSKAEWIWERYIKDPLKAIEESKTRHWAQEQGSEMLWWEKINPYCSVTQRVFPSLRLYSYKLENPYLRDAHIIYWHGRRKPHDATEEIVVKNWI
tara:strand:- start:5367 stop:6050 length:684 start_codon:yes stop_codon:yes gene_type:complete